MAVYGKILSYGDDLKEAFQIRKKVFVEEQNVPNDIEFDKYDKESIHVIVYDQLNHDICVATGRLHNDGEKYWIGHVAVLKDFRGRYYGDLAVRMLINKAFVVGINDIWIETSVSLKTFYEKIGFTTLGEEFHKNGYNYVNMVLHRNGFCTKCKSEN